MSFFAELKRRNVIRIAVAYAVAAWLLVQVLEIATDAFEAPAWVLKIVMTLLAIGLIPTLVFSWVYELTPDGLKKEKEVTADESVTAHTAKKLDIAVIGLLIVAIGLFAADRWWLAGDRSASDTTVASQVDASRSTVARIDGRPRVVVVPGPVRLRRHDRRYPRPPRRDAVGQPAD